jgi:DNA-binding response OmpR family regulator
MRGGAAADSDKPAAQTQLSFDRYVLDLSRGCLLLNGNEVRLRPKTFAVLKFLVENAGRLVLRTKSCRSLAGSRCDRRYLVQSIGELRRELSEDGPRLIKTSPTRLSLRQK